MPNPAQSCAGTSENPPNGLIGCRFDGAFPNTPEGLVTANEDVPVGEGRSAIRPLLERIGSQQFEGLGGFENHRVAGLVDHVEPVAGTNDGTPGFTRSARRLEPLFPQYASAGKFNALSVVRIRSDCNPQYASAGKFNAFGDAQGVADKDQVARCSYQTRCDSVTSPRPPAFKAMVLPKYPPIATTNPSPAMAEV